ncbi:hypothetical protein V8E55_011628 [Tylopilus felleus]
MFAKLSALALCLSFASALNITAPKVIIVGKSTPIEISADSSDPDRIDMFLHPAGVSSSTWYSYDDDVLVHDRETIHVTITSEVLVGTYSILATKVGNLNVVLANSNYFEVLAP